MLLKINIYLIIAFMLSVCTIFPLSASEEGYLTITNISNNIDTITVIRQKYFGLSGEKISAEKGSTEIRTGDMLIIPKHTDVTLESSNGPEINLTAADDPMEFYISKLSDEGEAYVSNLGIIHCIVNFIKKEMEIRQFFNVTRKGEGHTGGTDGTVFEIQMEKEKGITRLIAIEGEIAANFNYEIKIGEMGNEKIIKNMKRGVIISGGDGEYRSIEYPSDVEAISEKFDDYDSAIDYFNKQLKEYEHEGEDIEIVSTKNNIGRIYFGYAEYEKARKFFEASLDDLDDKSWFSIFQNESEARWYKKFWTATLQNNIGTTWYKEDEYDKAVEHYRKALEIDLEIFGEEHPETAITYNNLALVLSDKEDFDDALYYEEKSQRIRSKFFSKDDPVTATAYNSYGYILYGKQEYGNAARHFEKALNITREIRDDAKTAIAYNNMGSVYRKKGKYYIAKRSYENALKFFDKKNKYDIAVTYNNLGLTLRDKGDYESIVLGLESNEYDEAINYFEKALDIFDEDSDRAISFGGLISVYNAQGRYMERIYEAEDCFKELSKNGRNSLDKSIGYNGLASVSQGRGEYKKAIKHLNEALNIIKSSYDRYPNIKINSHYSLGLAWEKRGNTKKAIKHFKDALKSSTKFFGEEHRKTELMNKKNETLGKIVKRGINGN